MSSTPDSKCIVQKIQLPVIKSEQTNADSVSTKEKNSTVEPKAIAWGSGFEEDDEDDDDEDSEAESDGRSSSGTDSESALLIDEEVKAATRKTKRTCKVVSVKQKTGVSDTAEARTLREEVEQLREENQQLRQELDKASTTVKQLREQLLTKRDRFRGASQRPVTKTMVVPTAKTEPLMTTVIPDDSDSSEERETREETEPPSVATANLSDPVKEDDDEVEARWRQQWMQKESKATEMSTDAESDVEDSQDPITTIQWRADQEFLLEELDYRNTMRLNREGGKKGKDDKRPPFAKAKPKSKSKSATKNRTSPKREKSKQSSKITSGQNSGLPKSRSRKSTSEKPSRTASKK